MSAHLCVIERWSAHETYILIIFLQLATSYKNNSEPELPGSEYATFERIFLSLRNVPLTGCIKIICDVSFLDWFLYSELFSLWILQNHDSGRKWNKKPIQNTDNNWNHDGYNFFYRCVLGETCFLLSGFAITYVKEFLIIIWD